MSQKPHVCIVGGGMITQIQILPSIYHLQRCGLVGDISICALNTKPLKALAEDKTLKKAFPLQSFIPHPPLTANPDKNFPELFKEVIAKMPQHNIAVVAVPDQLHYPVIQTALDNNQHICCVKPLVLKYSQAEEIAQKAYGKGLVIGIEYHKRFDDRNLITRRKYRQGQFGRFRLGQAVLHECWYYRHSNFQNWCTCENSDMFSYIACHYIDLVAFITGLLPTQVSVYGIVEKYPNGNEGYLWTDGRIIWENQACLNVQNALAYPDDGPGGNFQGMRLYCCGDDVGTMIIHNDQFRGVEHAYLEKPNNPGDSIYAQPNPDYFQYLDLGSQQIVPTGYGYRSIEYIIKSICKCLDKDLTERQKLIKQFDEEGIMATPANSSYNELVIQAGRLSILNNARQVDITYGQNAGVKLHEY